MDTLHNLAVRFHFLGEFINVGRQVQYIGGSEAISYIDRDKISLPELIGHVKDHCRFEDGSLLHWLFPGKDLNNGLRILVDDSTCQFMSDCITEGGVAEVYVEHSLECPDTEDIGKEPSDYEAEMEIGNEETGSDDEVELVGSRNMINVDSSPTMKMVNVEKTKTVYPSPYEKDIQSVRLFYGSISGSGSRSKQAGTAITMSQAIEGNSSEDSDYIHGDDSASEVDEEAQEILKKFKEFKRKCKAGEIAKLDDVEWSGNFHSHSVEGEEDGNATPYEDSSDEEGDSFVEESDGELVRHNDGLPVYKDKGPRSVLRLGMKFADKRDFKEAVKKHGLEQRKVIIFVKDEGYRVRAKCDWKNCPWVCLLSTNSRTDSWQISTFNDEHNCPPRRDNKLVTARRIAAKYENMLRANPQWSLMHLKATVQEEMFADVSMSKVKRAKAIVMEKVFNSTKGEYGRLYDYQLELLRSNPGSTVIVKVENSGAVFQRFYVCLDALKKGFLAGCRKVIGLDGCFFKGCTNGVLLCALGRDANNQMYPIAWAVVEMETNDSWDWFCDVFFRDIQVGDGDGWVIISDQQKGILNAVAKWAPRAEHRNCARHVYANWRKKFKKKDYQKKWWMCAKSSSMALFNYARTRLAQCTPEGARALLQSGPEHYCRAYFKLGSNCDSVDNNICESFNKWIIDARFLPIISMLEEIRCKVMVRIQAQRAAAERWTGTICPNICKKLKFYISLSGNCHAISNGRDAYEVKYWDHRFVVSLVERTCSCRYWQLSGLPCPHAIACIFFKTNCLDDYVADCYSIQHFKRTYEHCLEPLEGMTAWPKSDLPKPNPPGYVKMPGGPKKSRKREPWEKSKSTKMSKAGGKIRCSKCKSTGHNTTTCDKRHARNSEPTPNARNSEPTPNAPRHASCEAQHVATSPAEHNALVPVHDSQQSGINSRKRKATSITNESSHSSRVRSSQNKRNMTQELGARSFAKAKVHTMKGGSASINLEAQVAASHSSSKVNISVTSGSASSQVNAYGPPRKKLTQEGLPVSHNYSFHLITEHQACGMFLFALARPFSPDN